MKFCRVASKRALLAEPTLETDADIAAHQIYIEVTITDLSEEQKGHFRDYIEWWNMDEKSFHTAPPVEGVDADEIVEALRVAFIGVQLLDGFQTTTENVRRGLVPVLRDAGFRSVRETHREMTLFGTLSLYQAHRGDGNGS